MVKMLYFPVGNIITKSPQILIAHPTMCNNLVYLFRNFDDGGQDIHMGSQARSSVYQANPYTGLQNWAFYYIAETAPLFQAAGLYNYLDILTNSEVITF